MIMELRCDLVLNSPSPLPLILLGCSVCPIKNVIYTPSWEGIASGLPPSSSRDKRTESRRVENVLIFKEIQLS